MMYILLLLLPGLPPKDAEMRELLTDAVGFVGQHARANSPGGVMAHNYSSLGIRTMTMNAKPVGEIETRAALAGP